MSLPEFKRNVIVVANGFTSDEYWPGWLLAKFLSSELNACSVHNTQVAIAGGGTFVVVQFPEHGFDVNVGCYRFVEYVAGFSCHVRLKRRIFSWRKWISQSRERPAQQLVCDCIDRAFEAHQEIDLIGWFTDLEYKQGRKKASM